MLDLNGNGYEVCKVVPLEDTDGLRYETLQWGYDTAAEAFHDLRQFVSSGQFKDGELCVIRFIDPEDAEAAQGYDPSPQIS